VKSVKILQEVAVVLVLGYLLAAGGGKMARKAKSKEIEFINL